MTTEASWAAKMEDAVDLDFLIAGDDELLAEVSSVNRTREDVLIVAKVGAAAGQSDIIVCWAKLRLAKCTLHMGVSQQTDCDSESGQHFANIL